MIRLERWTEPLAESNCYLLGEEGRAVVIDPNDPAGPLSCLEGLGWEPELILLTHEHCDHMSGLEALRARYPAANVVCSGACSAGIQDRRRNMSLMMEVYLSFRGKPGVTYPPFTCRPADTTYEEAWETRWRGHRLRCRALPGHTPGSACIFLDEETLFSGDYLIPGEEVILRLPGGNAEEYETHTAPVLAALPAGLNVCPGHGEPYTLTGKEDASHGLG